MPKDARTQDRRPRADRDHRPWVVAVWLLLCGSVSAETGPTPRKVVGSTLQTFKLSDQFDKEQVVAFPHDRPTLLCIADRKSSPQIGAWTRRIHKELPAARCRVVGLAVIKGVPFFLRGMVRGFFQKSGRILMDWGGKVGNEVGVQAGACAVVLVDRQGVVRHVIHGPFEDEPFEDLMAAFGAVEGEAVPTSPSATP